MVSSFMKAIYLKKINDLETPSLPTNKNPFISSRDSLDFLHFDNENGNFYIHFFAFSLSKCKKSRESLEEIIGLLVVGSDGVSKSFIFLR